MLTKIMVGGLIVGLFSMIFGANEVEVTRPDFANVINKAVHFNNGVSLSYDIPGNLSKLFGYAEGYVENSARTFKASLGDKQGFESDGWRLAKKIDGGMWDYLGDKKKGLGGELGTLNVNIALNSYPGGAFDTYLVDSYEVFLNGPEGKNTEIRQSEMGEGATDEELGHWIVTGPGPIDRISFSDREFLSWRVSNEHRGYEFIYYALPVDDTTFITFLFYYTAKANNEQEYAEHSAFILEDIQTFMQRVVIK